MPKKIKVSPISDDTLNRNLNEAKNAFKYLKIHILGATNVTEDLGALKNRLSLEEIRSRVDIMREIKIEHPEMTFGWFKDVAKHALQYLVGNCCEIGAVTFFYFVDKFKSASVPLRVELFNNPFLDHFFVVIGRTQGDPNDPRTWNDSAVIVDFWANEIVAIKHINFKNAKKLPTAFSNCISKNGEFNIQRARLRVTELDRQLEYEKFKKAAEGDKTRLEQMKLEKPRIIQSDVIVLRQAVLVGKDLPLPEKDMQLNHTTPMLYEGFYMPTKSDYKKHAKEESKRQSFTAKSTPSLQTTSVHSFYQKEKKAKETEIKENVLKPKLSNR